MQKFQHRLHQVLCCYAFSLNRIRHKRLTLGSNIIRLTSGGWCTGVDVGATAEEIKDGGTNGGEGDWIKGATGSEGKCI